MGVAKASRHAFRYLTRLRPPALIDPESKFYYRWSVGYLPTHPLILLLEFGLT
jgi:hypothetical protein